QGPNMGHVHPIDALCTPGVTVVEGKPTNFVATCWHGPVATNYSDEILFGCLGNDVFKYHVMDLATFHPPIAAVLYRPHYLPFNQLIKACLCNILNAQTLLLPNKTFRYPSSDQPFPTKFAAFRKYA
uniref:Uncharacterized protein n=1 Tax=Setaria italica TaxID=4555 RepID=K3ZNB0_SETIT